MDVCMHELLDQTISVFDIKLFFLLHGCSTLRMIHIDGDPPVHVPIRAILKCEEVTRNLQYLFRVCSDKVHITQIH